MDELIKKFALELINAFIKEGMDGVELRLRIILPQYVQWRENNKEK